MADKISDFLTEAERDANSADERLDRAYWLAERAKIGERLLELFAPADFLALAELAEKAGDGPQSLAADAREMAAFLLRLREDT